VDLRPAPAVRTSDRPLCIPPAGRESRMLGPRRFRFLNSTRDITPQGWDDAQVEKLWRFNLHYFDDLNAVAAADRVDWHRDLVRAWVRENPPGIGTGWEPYPTSLRIVNWVKWAARG